MEHQDCIGYEVDIQEASGKVQTIRESVYRCTNPDCDCETILRSYCFCPMCGFPINWNNGTMESDYHDGDTTIEEDEDE